MSPSAIGLLYIFAAVFFDVIANIFVKKSEGFTHKGYGLLSLLLVSMTCYALGQSMYYLDLSVAYAFLGSLGLIFTTIIDKLYFHLVIHPLGALGLILMLSGLLFLHYVS